MKKHYRFLHLHRKDFVYTPDVKIVIVRIKNFIHHLEIKTKFLGLDTEIKIKEKVLHPHEISTFSS
ncbi:hypothetical protein C1149_14325 [Clostridium botulinum]|nr:hypothetical protein C1149_14325 [Clostridium botulinum]